MYSDQISTGRKRSIHERIDGDLPAGSGAGGRARHNVSKRQVNVSTVHDVYYLSSVCIDDVLGFFLGSRQRQIDEKWKHDLYREDDEPASKSMDPRDLRLKLQRRSSQPGFAGTKSSGVRDLREKLSGTMHPQPSNADPPKPKPVSEVVKITRRENAAEVAVRHQSKKASKQASFKKISQPKVDMAALRHMTDSDLKALGIPMGPRKKIILALESRA
ncbi:hypothetical protein PR202_ga20602 [Eleusine coracana subsp. coracana]|uniref:SAM domain-containing protein n=1 Tax=Eleusine coracana subsp. coracana TaxID=191504 RepID=A0AAV5CZH6_ELECO|nr:hypothetical protein PR202_ga20602 [Eleusine coracana subsp. coracana]